MPRVASSGELRRANYRSSLVFPSPMYASFAGSFAGDGGGEPPEPDGLLLNELDHGDDTPEGVGSIGFIFSLWNTMVGSTILVLPYGFSECGPVGAAVVACCTAGLSLFTALGIARTGIGLPDYGIACRIKLGQYAEMMCVAASLLVWSGVFIVYQIMMVDSLVSVVQLGWDDFKIGYGAAIIAAALFPLCCLKNFTILVRINSAGVLSVVFILFFIVYRSASRFANGDAPNVVDTLQKAEFKFSGLGILCGMLGAGFFSHNALHPLLRVKADQSTTVRDCSIAYGLVLISYMIAGLLPSLAFAGDKDITKTENFLLLDSFKGEALTVAAQISLLLQLCCVWPLLLGLIRGTIFERTHGTMYPGFKQVATLNAIYVAGSSLGTIVLYNVVGKVLSYVAAMSGILYMYLIPTMMAMGEIWLEDAAPAGGTSNLSDLQDDLMASYADEDESPSSPCHGDQIDMPSTKEWSENTVRCWIAVNGLVCATGVSSLLLPFIAEATSAAK